MTSHQAQVTKEIQRLWFIFGDRQAIGEAKAVETRLKASGHRPE